MFATSFGHAERTTALAAAAFRMLISAARELDDDAASVYFIFLMVEILLFVIGYATLH